MTTDPVFELRGGRVTLNSTLVLDDLDFRLASGEFLTLLGPNGSGKTTLIRVLLGLVPLAGGSVRVYDEPLDRFGQWSRIGYVPQRVSAVSGAPASVMEVVLAGRVGRSRWLRPFGARDRVAAVLALEAVGLETHAAAPIARLSGGQQQRVLIARALATEPDVLVLDEPLSGVDLEHQESFAGRLKSFNEGGGTVLLVAHGLGPMEDLVTREIVMHAGQVTYDGPHHPHHVHAEHVHHPEIVERSPLDRATGSN